MKKIKALASILLIALVLTGCNGDGGSAPVTSSDSGAESFSSSAVSATSSSNDTSVSSVVSENNESKQPVESEPIPEKTEVTRNDFQGAACKLKLWARFCYDLHPDADSDYCPPLVDFSRSVTDETNTETYYKLIGTSFANEEHLFGRQESYGYVRGMLDVMFTDKFQEEFWNSPGAKGITIKDGGVYVAPVSCGDSSVIKTVKIDLKLNDDKSVLATITHEPENGETEIYHATFNATEPKFGSVLKNLDSVDEKGMTALPKLFAGNVEVVSEQFDFAEITDNDYKRLPTREELDEILKLIRSYTYWQNDIIHFMNTLFEPEEDPMFFFVDPEQNIVISNEEMKKAEERGEHLYNGTYNKAVKSPLSSEKEFNELLDTMMTENFKEQFRNFNIGETMLIIDGDIYLRKGGGGRSSRGLGASWLELNSIGFTDDDTVLMKFTSVGDKEEWGLEKDIRNEFTAKLVKGSDGKFRFDDGDYREIACDLTFYNGMFYGNRFFLY